MNDVIVPVRNLRMEHDHDPRKELEARVGKVDHLTLYNNQILVAIYERPEKTKGGLYLPDSVRKEDLYQGKVGLVLKKGPLAFVDDARNDFRGQNVEVGDWIAYRVQDGWSLVINGPGGAVACRMLEDVQVRLGLGSPDDVY